MGLVCIFSIEKRKGMSERMDKKMIVGIAVVIIVIIAVSVFVVYEYELPKKQADRFVVGYVDITATASALEISSENLEAYDLLVFAFAQADGTIAPSDINTLASVRSKQAEATLTFLSYGGQAEYPPGQSVQLTSEVAHALVNTSSLYQFDGIDLNLEAQNGSKTFTAAEFEAFAVMIHTYNESLMISSAPQLVGITGSEGLKNYLAVPGSWALWGTPVILDSIYTNPVFNYIFIQAYNSNADCLNPETGTKVNQTNPSYVESVYYDLQQNGFLSTIPGTTKVLVGIPANARSGNGIWSSTEDKSTITNGIIASVDHIVHNKFSIDGAKFGGIMTWDINHDVYPPPDGYFSDNVAPEIQQVLKK